MSVHPLLRAWPQAWPWWRQNWGVLWGQEWGALLSMSGLWFWRSRGQDWSAFFARQAGRRLGSLGQTRRTPGVVRPAPSASGPLTRAHLGPCCPPRPRILCFGDVHCMAELQPNPHSLVSAKPWLCQAQRRPPANTSSWESWGIRPAGQQGFRICLLPQPGGPQPHRSPTGDVRR